jgi:hypothetical protein
MGWNAECLYMLAMIDYLCRENGLPVAGEYADLRKARLSETIFPIGIVTLCAMTKSDEWKREGIEEAIPEFLRHNIVEAEIRDVC